MIQLLLEKRCKKNRAGRVRNLIMIISLLWGSVKICQTHLCLVTPEVWERRRSKCKMMHVRGTVIERSKGTNLLAHWEKESFSSLVILLMNYETLVKNLGPCVAMTAPR